MTAVYGSGDLECTSYTHRLRSTEGEVEDEVGREGDWIGLDWIGIGVTGTVALGIEAACVPMLRGYCCAC
jgi:hypothetical protein